MVDEDNLTKEIIERRVKVVKYGGASAGVTSLTRLQEDKGLVVVRG